MQAVRLLVHAFCKHQCAQDAPLLVLGDEQHLVEEEDVPHHLGARHSERSLGIQLAERRQILALQQTRGQSLKCEKTDDHKKIFF